jgi:hypothetical protein
LRISFKRWNPFGFLFVSPRREQYLTQYVLREHARGRPLRDLLEDPYVRNRSTPEERARLLERPEVVAAIGERALADLKLALEDANDRGGDRGRRGTRDAATTVDGVRSR